ncbi:gamma-type small acid-soluble spore protein [Saliterribacillus persicus]|uniref:Small, acid-soluble spore protein gamma-type n=1 Tax=Saliterribacillus persicus TaxID=930114 RepID=A0A368X9X5_9BACI|nr:gamma-type small acid-soluble spore protein [Saliterribacillus persicus]RCW62834.1 small acid-soluble spore protein E (minor gamma-type SASP) [Saliterribacillus persicus]
MAKNQNQNPASKTNAQEVKRQNQKAAQGQGKFGTEFASETDAQEVRQQNQKANQKKNQNQNQNR